jgi:energy-coupling factor transport system substrate-specific component
LTVFALLGAMMFLTKNAMAGLPLPNIHPLGLFIAAFTLAYRARALAPLYVYVMVDGAFWGFSMWWIPYLYIWLPLWGMFMLVGAAPAKKLPVKLKVLLCMFLCGLHGLSFGMLYVPAQAVMFGLNFNGMVAWIIAGLPFDIIHAVGNLAMGTLIIPLSELLKKLDKQPNYP